MAEQRLNDILEEIEDTTSEASAADGEAVQAEVVEASEAESPEEKVEKLQALVVQMAADFENFKRAAARREAEARDRAARRVVEDLLPVFDNFDRAIQASGSARDVETMRIGLEFIGQQMQSTLGEIGVQVIESKGQKFDPALHDAIEEVPDSGQEAGTILDEASRGYTLNGTVLRAARVKVAG